MKTANEKKKNEKKIEVMGMKSNVWQHKQQSHEQQCDQNDAMHKRTAKYRFSDLFYIHAIYLETDKIYIWWQKKTEKQKTIGKWWIFGIETDKSKN